MCFGTAQGFIADFSVGFTVKMFILDNMYILFQARICAVLKKLNADIQQILYILYHTCIGP
jgi:hypothetical protein